MEDLYQQIANWTGLTVTNSALLAGVILGFMLKAIIGGKTKSTPALSSTLTSGIAQSPKKFGIPDGERFTAAVSNMSINMGGENFSLSPDQTQRIQELLAKGDKVSAIKELREASNLGLREAKQLADLLEAKFS